ncbi:MAG TPA: hypothetical protein VJT73_07560 [Polyangiaceae bacterium]|nr:hypothetical protein [Polyangiaceae bacterium]
MEATSRASALGNVEVEGQTYLISSLGARGYEAIRLPDRHCVGSLAGSSGWIWRLTSDCPELMQEIVSEAMATGLLQVPPPD